MAANGVDALGIFGATGDLASPPRHLARPSRLTPGGRPG